MSSFICSPIAFNSVENAIKSLYYNDNFNFPYSFSKTETLSDLYNKGNILVNQFEKTVSEILNTVRTLQVLCVSLQYKSHYVGTLDTEIQEQKDILFSDTKTKKPLTIVQLFKQIGCIKYQIEEEHLIELRSLSTQEEESIFFLLEMENALAKHIVSYSDEYDNAEWDMN